MFSFVNVGRRLSFMFKLGTEAGQKRESVFAFGEIGKGDGRRGERRKGESYRAKTVRSGGARVL
jgi:hypothetical protein